jgi:L,D-transpeptidase catalytic domain
MRRAWDIGLPTIVTLAAMAALAALTTNAAARQARPVPTTGATAPREAGEPIMAIVSLKSQQVTFYDADGWILRAPVSTGTTGRETPAGVFAILEKDKDHHSTLYDDAWMPNMQRRMASRCTAGHCLDMQPRMAACGCPTILRRSCSTRRGSGCG